MRPQRGLAACRWQQLPELGVWPQLALLQSFQQMVELQESSRLLVDLGLSGRPDHPYGDLKVRPRTCRRDSLGLYNSRVDSCLLSRRKAEYLKCSGHSPHGLLLLSVAVVG